MPITTTASKRPPQTQRGVHSDDPAGVAVTSGSGTPGISSTKSAYVLKWSTGIGAIVEKTDIISTTGLRKTVHAVRIPAMHKGYTYPHYLMLMGSYPQGHPKI